MLTHLETYDRPKKSSWLLDSWMIDRTFVLLLFNEFLGVPASELGLSRYSVDLVTMLQ